VMEPMLARRHLAALEAFALSSVLLAFDYDGTLAPIAPSPRRARMRPTTRRMLAAVARCYPCIVISGRAHSDLLTRLEGLPLWHVFGNHGIEPWSRSGEIASRIRVWLEHLRELPAICPGIVVEDKTYSVTVHYRQAGDKARARREILRRARSLDNVRILPGLQAINLVVQGAPDKGTTLQQARRALHCQTAIYVGDDPTDEDAFSSAPPDQLLPIRVGRARESRALYCLRSQREVDLLLRTLLALRSRVSKSA
jgi:trehalose 6-phosphate phosphatase